MMMPVLYIKVRLIGRRRDRNTITRHTIPTRHTSGAAHEMAILFLNGTVIDGNGGVTEGGALLTSGGTIGAVGPTTTLGARRHDPDVTVVDLGGRTLMPGLIDTHVHLAGGDFEPNREGDPVARARADAFASFLPTLVDRIHALDPHHPVVYRDAEDAYLGRIRAAFGASGDERPWLVYGANVYSARRLQEVTGAWPAQWPGRPLLISEFAPAGMVPADRPLGFARDWATIRTRPGVVLGGMAYTWSTNGPEELDKVFGLVDPDGVPTDGALDALGTAYLEHQALARAKH